MEVIKVREYKINFTTNTITVSKSFALAASDPSQQARV